MLRHITKLLKRSHLIVQNTYHVLYMHVRPDRNTLATCNAYSVSTVHLYNINIFIQSIYSLLAVHQDASHIFCEKHTNCDEHRAKHVLPIRNTQGIANCWHVCVRVCVCARAFSWDAHTTTTCVWYMRAVCWDSATFTEQQQKQTTEQTCGDC